MLSKRSQMLKPSPTLVLAARAKELKAEGKDVISLSVGEPDWDTPLAVKKAAIQAIEEGQTKYTPAAGVLELRQAICQQLHSDFAFEYSPKTQVTVATGAKYVLFAALQTVLDPGDEVIIPAPYWVSYPDMVEISGGVPVVVPCDQDSQFKLTAEKLKSCINEKTKLLMLNSPSNPTGEIYTREELEALAVVLREHEQIYVISDDIYNRLSFEVSLAPHLLQVAPDLKERVLLVNGVSKSYSMTGWRIGWGVGPVEWIKAMASFQSQSTGCPCSVSQAAALKALQSGSGDVDQAIEVLKGRRDFAVESLNKIEGVSAPLPPGAFYIWLDISGLLGKSYKGKVLASSRDLCQALLDDQLVVVVAGSDFGLEGYLRMSYALEKERMVQAIERIQLFTNQLV